MVLYYKIFNSFAIPKNYNSMKKKLLSLVAMLLFAIYFGQANFWTPSKNVVASNIKANKKSIINPNLYSLDINALKKITANSPKKTKSAVKSNVIVSFPDGDGNMQNFSIFKTSNFSPELEAQHPEITSYYGESINGKSSKIYFSISPLGLYSMQLRLGKEAVFIESYDKSNTSYVVYKKSDKTNSLSKFECKTKENSSVNGLSMGRILSADDGQLRTYRLALSCTGEYTQYFGGTKALALAAMNNTMTRVNGVFENDFAIKLTLIPEQDNIIFTTASSDPYSNAATGANGAWNTELMNVLHGTTYGVGDAKFDIGHLFGATGGGGNAGCIGCVCNNDTTYDSVEQWYWYKGQGFTSPADGIPTGDNFDIDYVAHEMGHQFGANHTWTHGGNEGTGVQVEPGSGSTIMGYAGITSMDVQPHSDAIFHAVSIQQVTNNIKAKTCSVNTATGNSVPTANAGSDYTVPKSTPFMLTGSATDANGDTLSYIWEQMDSQTTTTAPIATKTSGVNFRSWTPTATPVRYFPTMSSVLAGATTTAGSEITVEALPSVARTLNFRFTVRDNRAGGSANNSDDAIVTVNATAGPFTVSSQATATSYTGGSSQTVTWNVAGTTANGVNCANVDILWSTDNGATWTTLLAATPNDGTEAVTIPNAATTTGRIMVKGTNHIFFDVNNANITVTAGTADTTAPTAPTLSASGTTSTSTSLSWSGATDNVAVTGYDVYQGTTLKASVTTTSYTVTGLTASTTYSFTVKAKDAAGNISVASNTASVTTLANTTDTTAPTAPTLSASGTTSSGTTLSWSGATDNVGVTGYDVYQGTTLLGSTASTSYTVSGLAASTTYSFTVKAKDAAGNISVASNAVSVTTLAAAVTYCTAAATNTADEKIGNVTFGTINNTSTGTAGFEDFTALSTNVTRGTAYSLSIKPVWTSTTYSEAYAVYIDWNRDGDFADSGELAWSKAGSTTTPVTGSITIPTTATLGTTRMRVMMKYSSLPTSSCGTYTYGQVEDYSLNIVSTARIAPTASLEEIQLYPNPVKGDILNIKNSQSNEFSIYNASGRFIKSGKLENGSVNVNKLPAGVYLIKVGKTTKRFIKE